MYPEGEFLCIVSKQYDRGTREDNNNHVSERVKVKRKFKRRKNQFIRFYSRFCKNAAHACDVFFLIHFFLKQENVCSIFFSLFFYCVCICLFFICLH
jgi:hypothetical protein